MTVRLRRWAGRLAGRPRPVDLLIAAVVTLVTMVASTEISAHQTGVDVAPRDLDVFGYLLLAGAVVGLPWRRAFPTALLLWVFGCVTAYTVLGYPIGPSYLPLVPAFFTTIVLGDRRVGYTVLIVGYVGTVVGAPAVRGTESDSLVALLGLTAWLLVLAAAAEITRIRARARRAEAEQAAQAAEARREQARRQAGEERLRMAQDLHDVLAHQLALITVQANAGLAVLGREPDRAERSLRAIKDAGNNALAELRTVLDMLRAPGAEAPRRPAPLLSRADDLDRLVAGAHEAGLRVRWETAGQVRPLPGPVDQAGYRIMQEALTNSVRHAGPGTGVLLRVDYTGADLRVSIDDDGRGRPDPARAPGGGRGLPGMRERVAALGGTLDAGPKPGGGFRVAAILPAGDTAPVDKEARQR